ncbi:MAG TPA: ABC transporter permease [Gemmatimonadaceae bacterium]|nr:ABC transporter permease [Gemmatimonadaceae bacterium]
MESSAFRAPVRAIEKLRTEVAAQVAFTLRTALQAVAHNKLRAALTSLGILFGVASVIAMLAIGNGAEQEILAQMRLLGTNNVVVTPIIEQKEGKATDQPEREKKRFSPGLTVHDAESIKAIIPSVEATSGEVVLQSRITREGHTRSGRLVGVDTSYFRLFNLAIAQGGGFSPAHVALASPVCIIGYGVKTRFLTTEEPIGRPIKVGDTWLTVVGVLEDRKVSAQTAQQLGIRDANMDVYVPLSTMLARFRDRARVTERDIQAAGQLFVMPTDEANTEDDAEREERENPNQLDRIVVRVHDSEHVPAVASIVRRMLERRHNQVIDFEVAVPELLLKQEQRTRTIFNIVLGAIASISLIVGGIGIMNIMLATVLERIREIGVRRAVGATRRDIVAQFLAEAVLISTAGGVAGIVMGIALSMGIEHAAGIHSIVSTPSVIVAFGVSLAVGLVFGIVPAWHAAQEDPVACLRHE